MEIPIANCDIAFRFQCPKHWNDLEPTQEHRTRFCTTCNRKVFLCQSETEIEAFTKLRQCIAVGQLRDDGDLDDCWMGEPVPSEKQLARDRQFRIGQTVKLSDGPLAGQTAKIEKLDFLNRRALVETNLFGCQSIELNIDDLESMDA